MKKNLLKNRYFYLTLTLSIIMFTGCSDSSTNPLIDDGQDRSAPASPVYLTFLSVGNGEIHVKWDPNSEADLAGYKLYRAEETDNVDNYHVIYDSTATEYIDSELEYTTRYYYRVTAYDINGNESPLSEGLSGTPHNTRPPDRPLNLRVNAYNIGAPYFRLVWDPNTDPDLRGYKIFRGSTINNVSTFIDSTSDTYYEDYTVQVDSVYYYKITAFDKGGEESAPTIPDSDVALAPPVLISPINNAITTASPTFTWTPVNNAVQYRIFLLTASQAGEIWVRTVENTQSSILYNGSALLESGKPYWWKVATITKDPVGMNSISNTGSFRIQ